jgi:peptidoglycan-associated lipoprotein
MRFSSRLCMLFAVAVLGGSLLLAGCPKSPVVTQPRPGPVGPVAAAPPDAAGGAGSGAAAGTSPSAGEIAVTRPTPPTETAIAGRPGAAGAAGTAAASAGTSPLKDVFFEYDKAIIGPEQKTALNDNVNWLKANGRVKVVIEGHCDERGTAEYNLGLGDRRAKALRDYLVISGITADRISTISYGKERPFVVGHDENAWKMNRRGHFAVQGP